MQQSRNYYRIREKEIREAYPRNEKEIEKKERENLEKLQEELHAKYKKEREEIRNRERSEGHKPARTVFGSWASSQAERESYSKEEKESREIEKREYKRCQKEKKEREQLHEQLYQKEIRELREECTKEMNELHEREKLELAEKEQAQKGDNTATTSTESKEEKTAPKFGTQQISDAAVRAVEDVKRHKYFKNGEAACNVGLNFLFQALTGSAELIDKNSTEVPPLPIRANQMVELWSSSPHWEEIAMGQARELALKQAHELANQGYFIVAGWQNLDSEKSGHVAVVVPSNKMVDSKNWGCPVPMTMDTGEGNRWASNRLSEGFGADKKPRIKFYRYKGPIRK